MLKINGYEVNYEHLFIYDGENILYKTERPYELNLEIEGLTVRNARKINFSKNDVFEVKAEKSEYMFRNGKDLYIPVSVISIESVTEKQHNKFNGETNYKNVYTMKLHCKAFKWNQHIEKVYIPDGMTLEEYDSNGKFGSGFSRTCNMYDVVENYKTNESNVIKRYLTYDAVTEMTIDSDFYTRTEKTEDRLEREKIAEIISSCLYGDKTVSHYEVEALMKKLNITIKED